MGLHRIRILVLVVLLILPPVILAQDAPTQRLAEPAAAAQKQSEKVIRDLFKEEYSKKTPADQQALAKKLLQQGIDTKDDPATKYVLFHEAMEIAAKYGDVETAMAAVTETANAYEIDGLALKAKTLGTMMSSAKSPEAAGMIADACLEVIDEAVREEKFDVAKSLVPKAETAAKASKDPVKTLSAQKMGKEIADLQRESQKAKEAEKTLETNPADPDASLVLGRYLLVKGNVEKALTLLSKGADPLLRAAADKELAAPTKPEDRVAAGDAWWETVGKERNTAVKAALQNRAKKDYEEAITQLSGIARTKVEKRLSELNAIRVKLQPQGGWVNLIALIDPEKDAIRGAWRKEKGEINSDDTTNCSLEIPYQPTEEYDFMIKWTRTGGVYGPALKLIFKGKSFHWWANYRGGIAGFLVVDGKPMRDAQDAVGVSCPVNNGHQYTTLVEVRQDEVRAYLDGKLIAKVAQSSNIEAHSNWMPRNPSVLGIGSSMSTTIFHEIKVRELSGEGKRLR